MPSIADALKTIDEVIERGPFDAAWSSLENYVVPEWYKDRKFGIFIHWGAYSVPAFGNEWYPRRMYLKEDSAFEHHRKTYGDQKEFGYKDFIPMFRGERFDASEWAELFEAAGAKFVVPVAEHHDGFAMYDSEYTEWCAAKKGPMRDVVGELTPAFRSRDMILGLSTHRAERWWFFDGGRQFDSDVQDPANADLYGPAAVKDTDPTEEYLNDWLVRTCEFVDKYRPQIVWFDWWIERPIFEPYLQRFAAYYYNRGAEWGVGVAINYKHQPFATGSAIYDVERGQLDAIHPRLWQTDTSVSKNSWGYIDNHDYKKTGAIIGDLVDIVSKNGALLLNIGPKADGSIPEPEADMLREIGAWLSVNGEAIYNTRPWRVYGEGPTEVIEGTFNDTKRDGFTAEDIRYTRGDDALYAVALGLPDGDSITMKTLGLKSVNRPQSISNVALLGSDAPATWSQDDEALRVTLPANAPGKHALAFKIT